MTIRLFLLLLFTPIVSYCQYVTSVYFSKSCDTVLVLQEDLRRSDPDTTYIILSVIRKNNNSSSTQTIAKWNEKIPDLTWRNSQYELNADSASKYGIIENGEYLERDSVKNINLLLENYRYKRISKWIRVCTKGCGFSGEFRFNGDVSLYFDSTLIFHQTGFRSEFREGVADKNDSIPLSDILHDVADVIIYRSSSGKYYVGLEYRIPCRFRRFYSTRKLVSCIIAP